MTVYASVMRRMTPKNSESDRPGNLEALSGPEAQSLRQDGGHNWNAGSGREVGLPETLRRSARGSGPPWGSARPSSAQAECAQSFGDSDVFHLQPNLLLRPSGRQQHVSREDSIEHRRHLAEWQSGHRDGHLRRRTELQAADAADRLEAFADTSVLAVDVDAATASLALDPASACATRGHSRSFSQRSRAPARGPLWQRKSH
jgi:hypothetical protein